MKGQVWLLAAALLCPGLASAQAPATGGAFAAQTAPLELPSPAAGDVTPNAAGHPRGPSSRAPDVTVTAQRPCGKRDQACVEQISEEIWRKYPAQIATMCKDEKLRLFRQGIVQAELGADPFSVNNHMTPQTQALCEYGPAHGLDK